VTYLGRLDARVEVVGTALCLGIDPDPAALPAGFSADVTGIERFAALLLDAALEHSAAVKANVAFFEAFGSAGIGALERLRARIPADVPFIADAKRADIGPTAARQAVALLDVLGADAVTANAYLGRDALEPFLEHADRQVYVVCRTSNPRAGEIQDLDVDGEPLYVHVARTASVWADGRANVGLVVGATAPAELQRVRAAAPELPFLVPGIGAQGGDLEAVVGAGPAQAGPAAAIRGGGLLVNVSRAIASAALGADDPAAALSTAAARWAGLLRC
jgi:orotidine-5'-phosphate decarboxylase